jgi:ubiquinone/menaquinone biosynthesis C-methylase UbiE
MSSQKEAFLGGEGDAYFQRTDGHVTFDITSSLQELLIFPRDVLEIGCSSGDRLVKLHRLFGATCHGIDPSGSAIEHGRKACTGLGVSLKIGTAEKLDYADDSFDLVIFGHCISWTDPRDHFTIAAEANRVLADRGSLVIVDFNTRAAYSNGYIHKPGLRTHKMDFSQMFLWHPSYRLLSRRYAEHNAEIFTFEPDEAVTIDVLRKDLAGAFPRHGTSPDM